LGGCIAPLAILGFSSTARISRGAKLNGYADVIGVMLCVDVVAIADPQTLATFLAANSSLEDIALQHLILFLGGFVLWGLLCFYLNPLS
jgi:hypothetical protein